jgi:hypothetical protein
MARVTTQRLTVTGKSKNYYLESESTPLANLFIGPAADRQGGQCAVLRVITARPAGARLAQVT